MAALRSAFRITPRAQFLRPSAIASRSYAVRTPARSRPATDQAKAEELQEGQEDLPIEVLDPNMVRFYPR